MHEQANAIRVTDIAQAERTSMFPASMAVLMWYPCCARAAAAAGACACAAAGPAAAAAT